jgi:hypothetical protein
VEIITSDTYRSRLEWLDECEDNKAKGIKDALKSKIKTA